MAGCGRACFLVLFPVVIKHLDKRKLVDRGVILAHLQVSVCIARESRWQELAKESYSESRTERNEYTFGCIRLLFPFNII